MRQFIQFAILGIGSGAIYALTAQGIVLVYRGSGVLNFAHGAIGLVGACIFVRTWVDWHWPIGVAAAVAVLASAVLGLLIFVLVMRPLVRAAPIVRVIATIGLLAAIQQFVVLTFGSGLRMVPKFLPIQKWTLTGSVGVGYDRLILLAVATVMTAGLTFVYHRTRFGLATRATAENRRAAAALAHSPDTIGAINWALGGAMAGAAGVLIIQVSGLQIEPLVLLVIPGLAAALVGGFRSFPLTLLAALAIGMSQSLITRYVSTPGWSDAFPFLVIIVVLSLRGSAIPSRDELALKLPRVGIERIRPSIVVVATALVLAFVWFGNPRWAVPVTTTLVFATVALSLVVLTGLAGQISLGQYALAGVGAFVAARLNESLHWAFPVVFVVGIAAAILAGLVFALPSLRTRGVSLAVVTVGMALAVEKVVFSSGRFAGGPGGTPVHPPTIFGIEVDTIHHPQRYATAVAIAFGVLIVAVANLRSGPVGRRLLAVRDNERAAASLGIRVRGVKFYAFGMAAAIAGVGGIFLAFSYSTIDFSQFDVFASLNVVVFGLIGGVGFVSGAVIGALMAPGTLIQYFLGHIGNLEDYLVLFGGLLLVVTLIANPDGSAAVITDIAHRLRHRSAGRRTVGAPATATGATNPVAVPDVPEPGPAAVALAADPAPAATAMAARVPACPLVADQVRVTYGGVVALAGLSLTVSPGRITGLIGANGAGKTTFIDAVTGLTPMSNGSLMFGTVDIAGWTADRRARAGITRAFQSLELFDDLTVRQNLLTVTDRLRWWQWLTALWWRHRDDLPTSTQALIERFGLGPWLGAKPGEIPFGVRRLVSVVRAAAARPSVLLLDEPAAGLDDTESAELGDGLRWLARQWGIGILLVEHDVALVMAVSDEIVALDFGVGIFSGTVGDAVHDDAVRQAYLGADAPKIEAVP